MKLSRVLKIASSFAILHLAFVIGVAIWIAAHTARNPQAPMVWLLVGFVDLPAYIAIALFGEKIQSLQHVDWISQQTGSWITGE